MFEADIRGVLENSKVSRVTKESLIQFESKNNIKYFFWKQVGKFKNKYYKEFKELEISI